MANVKPIDGDSGSVEVLDAGKVRPWPVRILTIMLFVQAAGLIGLGVYNFNAAVLQQDDIFAMLLAFFSELPRSLAFGSLGLLTLAAGMGFLWLWRTGWPTAMLVQGLSLLVSLGLYLRSAPPYIFAIMGYCILMVIYLHHPEVQQAFQTRQMQAKDLEETA